MLKKIKKGFTLVELVVVIAIIAILSGVSVAVYVGITNKAKVAADSEIVTQLNTQLRAKQALEGKNATCKDAYDDALEVGFDLAKLKPQAGGYYVWDQDNDLFALLDKKEEVVFEDKTNGLTSKIEHTWKFVESVPSSGTPYTAKDNKYFSLFLTKDGQTEVNFNSGFDAGYTTSVTSVTYTGISDGQDVIIRTNGDQCILTVNAAKDNIDFYGFAKEINVLAVKNESMHIYGSANKLSVTLGHVQIEDTGIIFELATNTGSVTNNGYIAEQTSGSAPTGTAVGGDYQINSLERLEAFRDVVNSGKNFEGKTVKLTSDITLKDGWKPIGEGNRDVVATNTSATGLTTYFVGKFDGQNHTISNLNNIGFIPTNSRITNGEEKQYAYGLFALVGEGAEITNLKLEKVDIDTSRYANAKGDSVAALVGYSNGSLKIENVTVSGSIKASDAASSIIGRMYDTKGEGASVIIKNCTNNANVTATDKGGKAAGILPIISNRSVGRATILSITGCINNGNISSLDTVQSYAAPIVAYETDKGGATYSISNCTNGGNISALTISNDANVAARYGN